MDVRREGSSEASPSVNTVAFTVPEFCDAHRISRPLFYRLVRAGSGPRLLKAGRRTLITAEAAASWRSQMENATTNKVPA